MSAFGTPAWEQSKENAAPLQRGRNVLSLERAASLSSDEIERKVHEFEKLVRPSERSEVTEMKDDPLKNWLDYIKYYQTVYPSDTREEFLLLERCTSALVRMRQYADDDRFISVCAKYAGKTKDPRQVYQYLHEQKIGTNSALFWITWAFVAEKEGDFQFAEKIYKKGISKNAQPLQTIKLRHQQFQRRMSRHWLNASSTNNQPDEDGEEPISRGVLGGLSRDRVRANNRARNGRTAGLPRPSERQQNVQNQNQAGSFAIFVEQEGENAENGYNFDSVGMDKKRALAPEADRRKENSLAAERWNERGGLIRKQSHTRSKAPPLAFPVFVDEECADQHEKVALEQKSHVERQRQVRDERTFRERKGEESAAKLARDPLRYVLNPSQREEDLAAEYCESNPTSKANPKGSKEKLCFDKRILRNACKDEQNFEEARAVAGAYSIASSNGNFNLLKQNQADDSSQMDLDEGASFSTSVGETEGVSFVTNVSNFSNKAGEKLSRKAERVLFQTEASFEDGLNQTAISTASSTFHPADAVGLPIRKEEETINTKFAMKELSMMFSSPAHGLDDVARKTERQAARYHHSILGGSGGEAVGSSFVAIGDMLGTADLDNSIVNAEYTNSENEGPRNPLARNMDDSELDNMALKEIKSEGPSVVSLGCRNRHTQSVASRAPQIDPLRGPDEPLMNNPGFQIFEDTEGEIAENLPLEVGKTGRGPAFSIFEENVDTKIEPTDGKNDGSLPPKAKAAFTIFHDTGLPDDTGNSNKVLPRQALQPNSSSGTPKKSVLPAFSIFQDEIEENTKLSNQEEGESFGNGDTASSSLFGDAVRNTEKKHGKTEKLVCVSSTREQEYAEDRGDTATVSLFNEIFQSSEHETKSSEKNKRGFSIFVETENGPEKICPERTTSDTLNNQAQQEEKFGEVADYSVVYNRNVKMALRRLHAASSVASNSRAPLSSLLSTPGKFYLLPHILLPREFRRKILKGNTKITLGKHPGKVVRELGRGAYGVVVLMTGEDGDQSTAIGVKVQSPSDCLAWEYEILGRIEQRLVSKFSEGYPFPRALSFISLADGGMFGMTTDSKSGLNLVDLVNIYKTSTGQPVPELLALHYTSKMLELVEMLHWHGRILHCDVKPDNFVLSDFSVADGSQPLEYADLTLVDFGRAVDLDEFSDTYDDVRKVKLTGNASRDDMRCVAMINGKPWSFDIDTYGILCSAHVLLFGSHMELRSGDGNELKPAKRMKRYWQQDLWDEIFHVLLQVDDETGLAIGSHARSLRSIRKKIDLYLEQEKSNLRAMLVRQANLLPTSREKII